jgi:hypothetical protein
VLAAYLPYLYFQRREWMYTRFLLPAIPLMWLLGSVIALTALRRLSAPTRVIVGLPILGALVIFSLDVADDRFAFELKDGERKYVVAGQYVADQLPANAVVLSMQHSGSVRFYTRRPILRWDFVDPEWLDRSIEWLRAHGHAPYAVIDEWELERVKLRYEPTGQQTLQRLVKVAQFRETIVYAIR